MKSSESVNGNVSFGGRNALSLVSTCSFECINLARSCGQAIIRYVLDFKKDPLASTALSRATSEIYGELEGVEGGEIDAGLETEEEVEVAEAEVGVKDGEGAVWIQGCEQK